MLHHVKTGMLVLSISYLILGLLLLAAPAASLPWICTGFGAIILLTGAVNLVRYFRAREKSLAALFTLVGGVVTAGLGVFALLRPDYVTWILPLVFGLFVLVDGGLREQSAWQLFKRKGQKWWVVMLLGFVSCILGVLLIAQPFLTMPLDPILLCGIILVVEGVLNLGCAIYTAMELHALDRLEQAQAEAAAQPPEPEPQPDPQPESPAEPQPDEQLPQDTAPDLQL